jgi:hypothetical protein
MKVVLPRPLSPAGQAAAGSNSSSSSCGQTLHGTGSDCTIG